jgi:hypothetical protein
MIAESALAYIILFISCGCTGANVVLPETPSETSSSSSHASRGLYTKHADTTSGADSLIANSSVDDPVDLNPPAYVDVVETAAVSIHPSLHVRNIR